MEIVVSSPIVAEAEVKQYTLVGDDIHVQQFNTSTVPEWYSALVNSIVSGSSTISDITIAIELLQGFASNYTSVTAGVQNNVTAIDAKIENLKTVVDNNTAQISSVWANKISASEASAIAYDSIKSYFDLGEADAYFDRKISTHATLLGATASSVENIGVVVGNNEVRISSVENVTLNQHFTEWDGISVPAIGQFKVESGSQYTYYGPVVGWVRADEGTASSLAAFTTATNAVLADLQNQLDGVVDTYFADGVPSLTVYPSNVWLPTEYNNHVGDMYYNNLTGLAYRFVYDNVLDEYKWIEIVDTAVADALAKAQEALTVADGKMSIWYSSGAISWNYPNAKIDDILVQYPNNVLYRAVIDAPTLDTGWTVVRDTTQDQTILDLKAIRDGTNTVYYATVAPSSGVTYGQYFLNTGSWNGTYYTVQRYQNSTGGSTGTLGWYTTSGDTAKTLSMGYRAKVLADTAQSTANSANTNAATALSKLTNIASDSILSPVEKPTVIAEYDVMLAERDGIVAQAVNYGIITGEKEAYTTALTNLTSYLNTLTTTVAWNNLTDDTTINGVTFRSYFNTVYITKQALLDKISAMAKTISDALEIVATDAYNWSAKAAKFVTNPEGLITGWQLMDGSNQASSMIVAADSFKVAGAATWNPVTETFDMTGVKTPLTIDTVTGDVKFEGKVSFTNVTGTENVLTAGSAATDINTNTTTIDGGKITTDSVWVGGVVVSSNFDGNTSGPDIGTPTTGFRLKANAAGTSDDPDIYGAVIKASVIDSSDGAFLLTPTGTKCRPFYAIAGSAGYVNAANWSYAIMNVSFTMTGNWNTHGNTTWNVYDEMQPWDTVNSYYKLPTAIIKDETSIIQLNSNGVSLSTDVTFKKMLEGTMASSIAINRLTVFVSTYQASLVGGGQVQYDLTLATGTTEISLCGIRCIVVVTKNSTLSYKVALYLPSIMKYEHDPILEGFSNSSIMVGIRANNAGGYPVNITGFTGAVYSATVFNY